jgi:hypothetical protein
MPSLGNALQELRKATAGTTCPGRGALHSHGLMDTYPTFEVCNIEQIALRHPRYISPRQEGGLLGSQNP